MTVKRTDVIGGPALALALVFGACSEDGHADAAATAVHGRADGGMSNTPDSSAISASFFVSSDTSATGNLGGLAGADARCERLARAAGLGGTAWKAYLSVEHEAGSGGQPINARDRIGSGPWYNSRGALLASNTGELHTRAGDAAIFLDENGEKIPGQWAGSPTPVAHDVLTGSNADGTLLAGKTCADWTSVSATLTAQVGHSDGLGPGMSSSPPFSSWNSAHANGGCNDTAPLGGAGRIYCFLAE